jgi:Mlc titration factor MtfA (ptsG expression regulator)
MLMTPEKNRRNQRLAFVLAVLTALALAGISLLNLWLLPTVLLSVLVYHSVRRRCVRRLAVMEKTFPPAWEEILQTHVAYFNALSEPDKARFRRLVKIFLDEVRITGIRTEVDDLTRVLVAASAIIPVFGFPDWEYGQLGEVLIYPSAFDRNYRTDAKADKTILGMVGLGHLDGVMILSKPELVAGFANPKDKQNVGIHEFAHLVDKADGVVDGIPLGMPAEIVRPWVEWVGRELAHPPKGRSHINLYAYTNETEYFAVLAEYFFEAPEVLERKNPELYRMLQMMFRQDTRKFLDRAVLRRPQRLSRNSPCPCGSGKKYKACCLVQAKQGVPG